jgi:5-methylcytosine-specific restriction protein A
VLERDRYVCQLRYVGCTGHATIADHKVSIAALGMTRRDAVDVDACQAVCAHCHRVKTQREATDAR